MKIKLFPAHAGVIPLLYATLCQVIPFPRPRGGDPYRWCLPCWNSRLFPAHAGVIHSLYRSNWVVQTFPRPRGGDPTSGAVFWACR